MRSLQRFSEPDSPSPPCEINCSNYSRLCFYIIVFRLWLVWPKDGECYCWIYLLMKHILMLSSILKCLTWSATIVYSVFIYIFIIFYSNKIFTVCLITRIVAKALSPRGGSPYAAFGFAHRQVKTNVSLETFESQPSYYYAVTHTHTNHFWVLILIHERQHNVGANCLSVLNASKIHKQINKMYLMDWPE